jgi:hypothetical protein
MVLKCKPGDDAYVIYSDIVEQIGRRVHVESLSTFDSSPAWVVTFRDPMKGPFGTTIKSSGIVPDKLLLPIKGDPTGNSTNTDKDIHTKPPVVEKLPEILYT